MTFFGRPETNDVLNPHRSVNEFRGNDFRRAKLESVAFRAGIRLTDRLLPTGGDFVLLTNAQRRLATARRAIKRWPSEERDEGLLLLDYLDDGVEEQDQILIDAEDFDDIASEEVAQRVLGLLDPRGD